MTKLILIAAIALSTMVANAGSLALLKATGEVKKTVENVSVNAGAVATLLNGQSINLTTLGAGLRSKKVLFINAKVYVGQLLTDNASQVKLDSSELLTQLNNNNANAFTMTFVRSVSADQLMTAFREGFNANNIDMNTPAIQGLLNAISVGGDINTNDVLVFLLTKNADGTETLSFQNQKGVVTSLAGGADKSLASKILALWIGQGADSGVTELKKQILQGL